jgi:hypothetical protein
MVMLSLQAGRSGLVVRVALGLFVFLVSLVSAQDDPQAKQRLEFMQAAVRSLEPEASELKSKDALRVSSKPLLRYSDPTRGGINEAAANVL